jgi:hypothetical protein
MNYYYYYYYKLEYASVVGNTITSIDANKLERIQQKFTSVCCYRVFLHVPYTYTLALEKLGLHSLPKRRHYLDAFFFVSGNSHCSVLVPLTNTVLLLGAPMLPTWLVKISIYLHLEAFILITSILLNVHRMNYYSIIITISIVMILLFSIIIIILL